MEISTGLLHCEQVMVGKKLDSRGIAMLGDLLVG